MIFKRKIFSRLIAIVTIMTFSFVGCESDFDAGFQQTEVPAGTGDWLFDEILNLSNTGLLGNTTSPEAIAQSFQATDDCNVSGFWIKISRTGTFSYNEGTGVGDKLVGYLCENNVGIPDTPDTEFRGYTEKIIISKMDTEAEFVPFVFNIKPHITGGIKYWIKIEIEWDDVPDTTPANGNDDNEDDVNSYITFYYSAGDEYASHNLMADDSGWTPVDGDKDLGIKIWGIF